MNHLKEALADTGFPSNPVVIDAFKIIKAHVAGLCPDCNGGGKVRIWYAQDELGQPEECQKCKGTGREVKKTPMPRQYCTCVETREDLGPLADPNCPGCGGHGII